MAPTWKGLLHRPETQILSWEFYKKNPKRDGLGRLGLRATAVRSSKSSEARINTLASLVGAHLRKPIGLLSRSSKIAPASWSSAK